MKLEHKTAIVTGGAAGFGQGIARRLAAAGARVVVADRDEAASVAVAAAIEEHGGSAAPFQVDVSRAAEVAAMVDFALERFGGLDILVNNAGLGQRPSRLEETSDEVFDALFEVNMRGVHLGCRYALPVFRRQGSGVIINTASGIALTPRPNLVAYGASKGWVVTYTKGLAMELAAEGIRVNALCPAAGDTAMLAEFMGGDSSAEGRDRFSASIPMGRLVSPDDMGAAALFLAGEDAAMITGTCLAVDGGRCI